MLNRLLIVLLLMLIPVISIAYQNINQSTPYHLMFKMVNKTFTRLKTEQNKIHHHPDYLRTIVREELFPYMHIKYAGALVLNGFYHQINYTQFSFYLKAFQEYLEQYYGQSLAFYNNQLFRIIPGKILNNTQNVSIRLEIIHQYNQPPIHLDFQWRKNSISGIWQVYDILIEGISMITTKQKEWSTILNTKGIEELTSLLIISAKQPIVLSKKNDQ